MDDLLGIEADSKGLSSLLTDVKSWNEQQLSNLKRLPFPMGSAEKIEGLLRGNTELWWKVVVGRAIPSDTLDIPERVIEAAGSNRNNLLFIILICKLPNKMELFELLPRLEPISIVPTPTNYYADDLQVFTLYYLIA